MPARRAAARFERGGFPHAETVRQAERHNVPRQGARDSVTRPLGR